MPPVDAKVAVQREHAARVVELRHADQAGVRQRGGDILIAREQRMDSGDLLVQRHAQPDDSALDECQRLGRVETRALQQEAGFRDNRFAGEEWGGRAGELSLGPGMVPLTGAVQRHPGAGIKNELHSGLAKAGHMPGIGGQVTRPALETANQVTRLVQRGDGWRG